MVYDDDFIDTRAGVIQVAINARREVFRDETSFVYQPLKDVADEYRWSPETFESVIRDYNTRDIAI